MSSFTLDLTGLKCPLPALKTRKKLLSLENASLLEVITTDPMAVIDIPHLISELNQKLISQQSVENGHRFMIERVI